MFDNFEKYANVALSLKRVAALFICLYMMEVSSATLICPIYTITNTQSIRIYPAILKFILVKISPNPGRLRGKHAKENQILFTFLTTEIYPDSPVHSSANTERIQICPVLLYIYAGKCIYTVI